MFGARAVLAMLALIATACSNGDAPVEEAYPAGPYGVEVGDTIANLALYDIEGAPFELSTLWRAETPVVLVYVTATWCFSCRPEIEWLNEQLPGRRGELEALSVVVQDVDFQPARPEDGVVFRDEFDVRFPIVVDPDGQTEPLRRARSIPLNVIVRTADMTITHRSEGFDPMALDEAIRSVAEGP